MTTEELAKRLWGVYFEGSAWKKITYPSNQAQKISFERLAKEVQRLIIEARIEELYADYVNISNPAVGERIIELTKQLKEVEQ